MPPARSKRSRSGRKPSSRSTGEGPATVVISQRIAGGREESFRRWQKDADRAAATFPGFLGSKLVPPDTEGAEWTIIYHFDSVRRLERWLSSDTRAALLSRAEPLLAEPASRQFLLGEREQEVVSVVISHDVRPEDTEEFLAWQQRMIDAERAFPGFRGSETHPPVPGIQDKWTVIYRFDSTEALDRWLASPERAELLRQGERFRDFEMHRIVTPFGSWFPSSGDGAGGGPPSWKTALSVLIGLYPLVVLLTLGLNAIWPDAPLWIGLLVGNVLSVSALTWLVMPTVTRALRFWLSPPAPSRRIDLLGLAAAAGFLACAATIFWLVTRVVWTLP